MLITPVAAAIANWPPLFPLVICQLFPAIESPVVATVMIAVPVPVFSAIDAVWLPVIAIALLLNEMTTFSVTALLPSVIVKVTV